MGEEELWEVANKHQRPVVITGFEAEELLEGILECVRQLERGQKQLANAYPRAVKRNGNQKAQEQIKRVMEPVDTKWRGLGSIPVGGYRLRHPFDRFAVESRAEENEVVKKPECPSALVLQGLLRPSQCEYYGNRCTPDTPMGAPMVSGEGACAAYYRYQR
jgi:hydrogenase expression/formation protein HypD